MSTNSISYWEHQILKNLDIMNPFSVESFVTQKMNTLNKPNELMALSFAEKKVLKTIQKFKPIPKEEMSLLVDLFTSEEYEILAEELLRKGAICYGK